MENGGGIISLENAGSTSLNSTIVANNMSAGTVNNFSGADNSITPAGYNLIDVSSSQYQADTTDITGTMMNPSNPNLASLSNNGGDTPTHALQCPSPAIDNGDSSNMDTDQRVMMQFGGRRDIGAYEYQQSCLTNSTTGVVGEIHGSKIFPTPVKTNNAIQLNLPEKFGKRITVKIASMATGTTLQEYKFSYGSYNLDLSKLQTGTYLIQVHVNHGVESHKLIVIN